MVQIMNRWVPIVGDLKPMPDLEVGQRLGKSSHRGKHLVARIGIPGGEVLPRVDPLQGQVTPFVDEDVAAPLVMTRISDLDAKARAGETAGEAIHPGLSLDRS